MPSSFERVAALMGVAGLTSLGLGAWSGTNFLFWLGWTLATPLILGGIFAAVIGLPLAFFERLRARRQQETQDDEDHGPGR